VSDELLPSQLRGIAPGLLTWPQVDPARHVFDPQKALVVVQGLPPAAVVPARPPGSPADSRVIRWSHEEGARWADAMSAALIAHYGPWACGWRWSVGEADIDGGPVAGWCCPRDSMTTPEATLRVVAAALVEWRDWLEETAERFSWYLPIPVGAPDDVVLDVWERAVARLVTAVVDRTGAESGWYGHCKQVLGWFLTAADIPEARHQDLIEKAVGGRFASWVTPSNLLIADVAEQLATHVVRSGDA
jgi:hypothetical protein